MFAIQQSIRRPLGSWPRANAESVHTVKLIATVEDVLRTLSVKCVFVLCCVKSYPAIIQHENEVVSRKKKTPKKEQELNER